MSPLYNHEVICSLVMVLFFLIFIQSNCFAMTVTSPFGWRSHPITGEWNFHSGIDIGLDYGTPIPSMYDGQVVYAGVKGGYGNCIIVNHGNDIYTLYGHCSNLIASIGEKVNQGQTIALVGSTGTSTGPHLHLELWENGQYVDPMKMF